MNGWLLFGLLLSAWLAALVLLRGRPLGGGFEFAGPILMWRTQFGKKSIEKVSKPGRFWNVVADIGIVLTWILGILIFVLLVLTLVQYVMRPEESAATAPGLRQLIGLPGINPLIPVGYGIAALILALVIHEGSHGVMAYVAKMRVKSLGLVFLILPIGAFVEPHEEDMMKATTRQKNRVFAAGPTSNIVLALVAGVLLSTLFVGQMEPADADGGLVIGNVEEGSAASLAGLRSGDLLTAIGDAEVTNRSGLTAALEPHRAGDRVTLSYVRDGQPAVTEAVLGDLYAYYEKEIPDQKGQPGFNDTTKGKAFLGVGGIALTGGETPLDSLGNTLDALAHPFASLENFFFYLSYPFFIFLVGIDALAQPFASQFILTGPIGFLPLPIFLGAASLLYWTVWINLMLGTFNALPAGPLDGGQMFRATLSDRLMKRYRVDRDRVEVEKLEMGGLQLKGKDEETQKKLDRVNLQVSRATRSLGFFILGLILLPVFAPPLIRFLL